MMELGALNLCHLLLLDHAPSSIRVRDASFTGDRPQSKKLKGKVMNVCHLKGWSLSFQRTLKGIKGKVIGERGP